MIIYLAGPMTGVPQLNFPAFEKAAQDLRALGHEVISPAEMDREHGYDQDHGPGYPEAISWDMDAIRKAEVIALLPGWENSRGTCWEVETGLLLGLPIVWADSLQPVGWLAMKRAKYTATAGSYLEKVAA